MKSSIPTKVSLNFIIILTCRLTVFLLVPTKPRRLTRIGAPTGSTVELNWLPPLHPNGAIHYEIEYLPIRPSGDPVTAGSSSSPYFTLTLPNENRMYFVTVFAVNSKGRARSTRNRITITVTKTGMYKCKDVSEGVKHTTVIDSSPCRIPSNYVKTMGQDYYITKLCTIKMEAETEIYYRYMCTYTKTSLTVGGITMSCRSQLITKHLYSNKMQ